MKEWIMQSPGFFEPLTHQNDELFPTTSSIHDQLSVINTPAFQEEARQLFSNASEILENSGEKNKRASGSRYSVMNYDGELYLFLRGKIYSARNGATELITGKLAINRKGEIFFLKIVTYFRSNLLSDKGQLNNFLKSRTKFKLEIAIAHQHGGAPHESLVMRETHKHTKLYLMLHYKGYGADLLINKEKKPENTIKLTAAQLADIAIQFLQRALEIYKRGEVHRDVKPENFVVQFQKNQRPIVSIIDFNSLKKLIYPQDGSQGYYRGRVETTYPYLPPIYQTARAIQEDYYWGPATDLYAALLSANEAVEQIDMGHIPKYEKDCYQELTNIISITKREIEISSDCELNFGHPKLDDANIFQLERELSDLQEDISLIFSTLEMEKLFNEKLSHLVEDSEASSKFEQASVYYFMLELTRKLKEIQKGLIGQNILQKTLQSIRRELAKPRSFAILSPKLYILEACEVLETQQFLKAQAELEKWYRNIAFDYRVFDYKKYVRKFNSKQIAKAAAAVVYIYQNYIRSIKETNFPQIKIFQGLDFINYREAEIFFQRPEYYKIAVKLYFHFMQCRSDFENYYASSSLYRDQWREVVQEEFIERLHCIPDVYDTVGRIFNDALIDFVLIDYRLLHAIDEFLNVDQQREREVDGVFIAHQKINGIFFSCIKQLFFDDLTFFDTFFEKLGRTFEGGRAGAVYLEFLYKIHHPKSEGNFVLLSETLRFHYEERLKIVLAVMAIFQSLSSYHEVFTSPQKKLAILSFSLYFYNICVDEVTKFLEADHATAVKILTRVIDQIGDAVEMKQAPEYYVEKEKEVSEFIVMAVYTLAYKHHSSNDNGASVTQSIRKTFPSFKRYEHILDSRLLKKEFPFYLTRKVLSRYLLQESERCFEDVYHTLMCWIAESVPQQYGISCNFLSVQPGEIRFGESWTELDDFRNLLGYQKTMELYLMSIRYLKAQRIPYCTAQEILFIIKMLENRTLSSSEEGDLFSQFSSLVHGLIVNANKRRARVDDVIKNILTCIANSQRLLEVFCQYLVDRDDLQPQEEKFLLANIVYHYAHLIHDYGSRENYLSIKSLIKNSAIDFFIDLPLDNLLELFYIYFMLFELLQQGSLHPSGCLLLQAIFKKLLSDSSDCSVVSFKPLALVEDMAEYPRVQQAIKIVTLESTLTLQGAFSLFKSTGRQESQARLRHQVFT